MQVYGQRNGIFDVYPMSSHNRVARHKHLFYEIMLFKTGHGTLHYRGQRVPFHTEQVHICPPGVVHAFEAADDPFQNATVAIYPRLFGPRPRPARTKVADETDMHVPPTHPIELLKHLIDTGPAVIDLTPTAAYRAASLIDLMCEEFHLRLPEYTGQIASYVRQLVVLIVREAQGVAVSPVAQLDQMVPARAKLASAGADDDIGGLPQNPHVAKAIQWMKADLAHPALLSSYAKLLGLSEKYFIRLFTRVTGLSPLRYHARLRLFAAARHLIDTNQTVEMIAHRFGFKSRTHFNSMFRKHYGTSPSIYRHTHRRSH